MHHLTPVEVVLLLELFEMVAGDKIYDNYSTSIIAHFCTYCFFIKQNPMKNGGLRNSIMHPNYF